MKRWTTEKKVKHEWRDRIHFLSTLRNKVLEPLFSVGERERYERVLFMNDVIFCAEDALKLVAVEEEVDAISGIDFGIRRRVKKEFWSGKVYLDVTIGMYDSWVARDLFVFIFKQFLYFFFLLL